MKQSNETFISQITRAHTRIKLADKRRRKHHRR